MAEVEKDPRMGSDWGTIIEPPFQLGFQKLESGQIAEITDRLHTTEIKSRVAHLKPIETQQSSSGAQSPEAVQAIVDRLSTITKPPPESKRIGSQESVGILNSYAWKGWKSSDVLHQ